MGFIQEFKDFAVKGNAIDMAVGIIIGAAFNKVVQSVVDDLVMPVCGYALSAGKTDFKNLKVILAEGKGATPAEITASEVAIRYGMFINTLINFMIVAFTVFIMIKVMNKVMQARGNLIPFARPGATPPKA